MPLNWASVLGAAVGGLIPTFLVYLPARIVLGRRIPPVHASVTAALFAWVACGLAAYFITGHADETRNAELWIAYFLAASGVGAVEAVRASQTTVEPTPFTAPLRERRARKVRELPRSALPELKALVSDDDDLGDDEQVRERRGPQSARDASPPSPEVPPMRRTGAVVGYAVVLVLGSFLAYRFFLQQDESWLGLVYPDRTNLLRHEVVGEFPSLNECLDRVRAEVGDRGSYECGLNCRQRPSGLNVCERTIGNER